MYREREKERENKVFFHFFKKNNSHQKNKNKKNTLAPVLVAGFLSKIFGHRHIHIWTHFSGLLRVFISSRIKKGEGQRKEKCLAKPMMSNEANERLKNTVNMCRLLHIFFVFVFSKKNIQ